LMVFFQFRKSAYTSTVICAGQVPLRRRVVTSAIFATCLVDWPPAD